MTCSLTLLFIMWRGRLAARQPRIHCALRAGSRAAAGAHVDGFASMLLYVLRLRSAEKSKKSSKINDVTLLQLESRFYCAVQPPVIRRLPVALRLALRASRWALNCARLSALRTRSLGTPPFRPCSTFA